MVKRYPFMVGDLLTGSGDYSRYSTTDENAIMKVLSVGEDNDNAMMRVEILSHSKKKNIIGQGFNVENSDDFFRKLSKAETIEFNKSRPRNIVIGKYQGHDVKLSINNGQVNQVNIGCQTIEAGAVKLLVNAFVKCFGYSALDLDDLDFEYIEDPTEEITRKF